MTETILAHLLHVPATDYKPTSAVENYCGKDLKFFFEVDGEISGSDIKWNNFNGRIRLIASRELIFSAKILPFTCNCGVKAISHIYSILNDDLTLNYFIFMLESFANHCCNASILVGSDWTGGMTHMFVKKNGTYTITPPIQNPNYSSRKHEIVTFHKYLRREDYPDIWQQKWQRESV